MMFAFGTMVSVLATAIYAVAILVLVLCIGCLALRWLPAGAEARAPLPYCIALIPLLWAPLLACAGILLVLRAWLWGAFAIAGLLLWLATRIHMRMQRLSKTTQAMQSTMRDRDIRRCNQLAADHRAQQHHTPLLPIARVMTLNCRYGRADAQEIIGAVRAHHVQCIALQEVQPELLTRLDTAGLRDTLPYRCAGIATNADNGGCNVILSAFPLEDCHTSSVDLDAAAVPLATVHIPMPTLSAFDSSSSNLDISAPSSSEPNPFNPNSGDSNSSGTNSSGTSHYTVRIASAHPKSPMRGWASWSTGIRALSQLACHDAIPTLVMGDLNSHSDHPSFRALLRSGFIDALASHNHALWQQLGLSHLSGSPILTFPRWITRPRIELDHILVSQAASPSTYRLVALDAHAHAIGGTDHLAVIATLAMQQ